MRTDYVNKHPQTVQKFVNAFVWTLKWVHTHSAAQIAQVRGYADRQLRYPDQPYDVRNRRISITLLYNT